NPSIKSMMVPSAWGASRPFIFASIGGTYYSPYSKTGDLAAAAGAGVGNAYKTIGVVGVFNINDVSQFSAYSASFIVSRSLSKGSSISVGALHLFANKNITDAPASYYFVFSHAVQTLPFKGTRSSALTYSVGVGTGRFYEKSDRDIATGKSKHGTAVFGAISYEAFKNFNINAEWTGINIAGSLAWRLSYKFPAIAIGVADLTGLSGDRPRFIGQIGYAIVFKQKHVK
ncbi:MAG: hypothetical protein JWQ09_2360, partial [Segetibacter sp.]|nr:hypothetical protein [Segetibacter sp.]